GWACGDAEVWACYIDEEVDVPGGGSAGRRDIDCGRSWDRVLGVNGQPGGYGCDCRVECQDCLVENCGYDRAERLCLRLKNDCSCEAASARDRDGRILGGALEDRQVAWVGREDEVWWRDNYEKLGLAVDCSARSVYADQVLAYRSCGVSEDRQDG